MNYLRMLLVALFVGTFFVPFSPVFAEGLPALATYAPTVITEQSVGLNGYVNGNGMSDSRSWFEWGLMSDKDHYVETPRKTIGTFAGNVGENVSGLLPDTDYFARIVAENSRGKVIGNTIYFHTQTNANTNGSVIMLKTLDATFVDRTSATLNGYAAPFGNLGGYVWFVWGKTTEMGNETPRLPAGNTSHVYSQSLTNLEPETLYYYRSMGLGAVGRTQGEMKWFRTPKGPKTPPTSGGGTSGSGSSSSGSGSQDEVSGSETSDAGTISNVHAEPFGYYANVSFSYSGVDSSGGRASVDWGTTPELGKNADFMTVIGSGDVHGALAPLQPCAKYYYRAVITANGKRSVSAVHSFTATSVALSQCGNEPSSSTVTPSPSSAPTSGGTTNSGVFGSAQSTTTGNSAPSSGWGVPGWKPQPIFGIPFPGTQSANSGTASGSGTINGSERTDSSQGFFSRLFGKSSPTPTQNKPLVVDVAAKGDGGPHTTVEYRISYSYKGTVPLQKVNLKVIFPKDVVYIGDDTTNEFLLEDNPGDPERTYVLPIGILKPGDTRTVTMLGMTTDNAKNVPEARARLEYVDPSGSGISVVSSGGTEAAAQTAAVANTEGSFSILPQSLLGWIFFIFIVVGLVLGVRFARVYYEKRKAEIEAAKGGEVDEEGGAIFPPASPLPVKPAELDYQDDRDPSTGVTSSLFAQLPR